MITSWCGRLTDSIIVASCSVDDIVDHYKKEQIVEGYNLKEAVSVQVRLRSADYNPN